MPRRKTVWIHRPTGWPRQRHIQLSKRQRSIEKAKTGRHVTSRVVNVRGKQRCKHREYITNRNGKILRDPDTGYLAEIGCKKIATWERQELKDFLPSLPFVEITIFCDRHARQNGAK